GGKTVLLTTHYMFEADTLCDRVAVIARGLIVGHGTPRELKSHVADRTVVEVEAFGVDEETVRKLRGMPGVTSGSIEARDQAHVLAVGLGHVAGRRKARAGALRGARRGHDGDLVGGPVRVGRRAPVAALAGSRRAARGFAAAVRARDAADGACDLDQRRLRAR